MIPAGSNVRMRALKSLVEDWQRDHCAVTMEKKNGLVKMSIWAISEKFRREAYLRSERRRLAKDVPGGEAAVLAEMEQMRRPQMEHLADLAKLPEEEREQRFQAVMGPDGRIFVFRVLGMGGASAPLMRRPPGAPAHPD